MRGNSDHQTLRPKRWSAKEKANIEQCFYQKYAPPERYHDDFHELLEVRDERFEFPHTMEYYSNLRDER